MKKSLPETLKLIGAFVMFTMGIYFELLLLTIITQYALFDVQDKEKIVSLLASFVPFVAGVQLSIISISPINIATLFKK